MFRSTRTYARTLCRHFFFVTFDTPAGGGLVLLHCNGLFLNWRLAECGACGVGEVWSLCELHLYQSYRPGIFFCFHFFFAFTCEVVQYLFGLLFI